MRRRRPPLARFPAVYVQDSTTIALPDALQGEWRGCDGGVATGTTGTAAAVKAQVRLDLCHGTLHGPILEDGRTADQRLAPAPADLPAGAVLIQDLGYFAVPALAAADAVGHFWLTRLKVNTASVMRRDDAGIWARCWRLRPNLRSICPCVWARPSGWPVGCWRCAFHQPSLPSGAAGGGGLDDPGDESAGTAPEPGGGAGPLPRPLAD